MKKIPVHVVSGFLGAGKTTFLLRQLEARQGVERCAIVVNDFGEASLDATILSQHAPIREIPGGCICCTAPEGLVPALSELIATQSPDRIFIETTGLARPADVIDTVRRSGLKTVRLGATVVLVDPDRFAQNPPALLMEQLATADIVVGNRSDVSSPDSQSRLRAWVAERYPPVSAFHVVEEGRVPEGGLALPIRTALEPHWRPVLPSTVGFESASQTWPVEKVFDMGQLKTLYGAIQAERIKGVFHTDLGFYELQWAGGKLDARPSSIRSGSRVDVISSGAQGTELLKAWIRSVGESEYIPPEASVIPEVCLVDAGGWEMPLTRAALAALPEQVHDVASRIPGRAGSGVLLSEVLALAAASSETPFVVVASDGMTTAPVAQSDAGSAILVHSLDGEPYPLEKGGPFRIFVPPGEDQSACSNVKKVVRIVFGA
jgi:G3E family GTPase